ncbi:glycosyltransferase family 2 protein [Bacillus suaedae]|uniref:Glycosyltransferase family 2 protein n=1 Tax=Halalkalibacter suaedae TaxID=2822140 RepID=A0A940WRT3_9BACI|nr:glycosyltransferase family 2 protein [Bacillus suaedae]MBP3951514.1 glycosyltransferase family 2 protein [Bacillus suaedae]
MTPKVSVIIPVYNCEDYLSDCLDSILNQTYESIEIIIIDDGSTDSSGRIISHYKQIDQRIIHIVQENSGPSAARNKGISESKGTYLVFVDSDDTVETNYVEMLLNEMLASNADLVCCGYMDFSKTGVIKHSDFKLQHHHVLQTDMMEMVCQGTGGVLWSKIFKRKIIENNQLKLDQNLFMCEDLVFVLQYVTHCQSFASIPNYLYKYNRLNQGSISSNVSAAYIQNFITVWTYIEEIFHSVGGSTRMKAILAEKVQQITITLIELHSKELREKGFKKVTVNIKELLSNPYINAYKDAFSTKKYLYKPYIFLIKHQSTSLLIIYSVYISYLKEVKQKLTHREKVTI